MMKFGKYVLISAALLSGAACLTACSSDDTVSDVVNPNLSPDGKAVKTEFALNIPAGRGMRMTGETVQAQENSFRGMKDITLIPLQSAAYNGTGAVTDLITLADIAKEGEGSLTDNIKKYSDVMIPVGTKGFLFYGHAEQGAAENAGLAFTNGVLSSNVAVGLAPSDYAFALVATTDKSQVYTNTQANAIKDALNVIVGVEGWKDETGTSEMGKLFAQFTSLKAGSANSVLAAVQSLYDNVLGYTEEGLGKKIKDAIANQFTVSEDGNNTLSWKQECTFPQNVNLPDGAVALKLNDQKQFEWNADKTTIGGDNSINIANITFPASLYYTANTGVRTNASPTAKFPESLKDWTDGTFFNYWADAVNTTTRKIALAGSINYAVAQLETTFKCKTATLPAAVHNGVSQTVNVGEGFEVTGLLVGGQPSAVGYNFQPKAGGNFNMTVYDNEIVNDIKAAADKISAPNYTLLLSNKAENDQAAIYFAVELKNTSGVAFRGADGVVPVNGTFYLIGKLDPQSKQVDGVDNPSVFMPDYKTTANITIGTLATAYNTIPDLRSTNLELGLAVDLKWETGMSFDVEIGQ